MALLREDRLVKIPIALEVSSESILLLETTACDVSGAGFVLVRGGIGVNTGYPGAVGRQEQADEMRDGKPLH